LLLKSKVVSPFPGFGSLGVPPDALLKDGCVPPFVLPWNLFQAMFPEAFFLAIPSEKFLGGFFVAPSFLAPFSWWASVSCRCLTPLREASFRDFKHSPIQKGWDAFSLQPPRISSLGIAFCQLNLFKSRSFPKGDFFFPSRNLFLEKAPLPWQALRSPPQNTFLFSFRNPDRRLSVPRSVFPNHVARRRLFLTYGPFFIV